jgi:hypothetical protein
MREVEDFHSVEGFAHVLFLQVLSIVAAEAACHALDKGPVIPTEAVAPFARPRSGGIVRQLRRDPSTSRRQEAPLRSG